jgi:hypothetical protein
VAYFDIHQKGLRKAMKMYGMQALRCVSWRSFHAMPDQPLPAITLFSTTVSWRCSICGETLINILYANIIWVLVLICLMCNVSEYTWCIQKFPKYINKNFWIAPRTMQFIPFQAYYSKN